MSVNEFDQTKPATSGTDASADLRNNYLALAQGADLLNVYASTPNDKKIHYKAANRAYIGATRLNVASGELNMTNFNSYIGTDGYWAKALICMNLSGEKDVRVGAQAQYSGETAMPTIPSYEIPMASVNFQRNGSSINNIANTNIDDMRPVVMGHDGVSNAANATNAANAYNLIRDIVRGLVIKNNVTNPNYQVDIDADEVILQNSSNNAYRATSIDVTADITVNGINGYPLVAKTGTASCSGTTVSGSGTLFTTEFVVGDVIWFNTLAVGRRITVITSDTALTVESSLTASSQAISNGGEAPNTWYHIWVIYNGTTVASLFSTSGTSPVMPSGYTYKAYIGAIYSDSISNFRVTHQQGNKVVGYGGSFNFSDTIFTSKDISTYVPSTAKKVIFNTQCLTANIVVDITYNALYVYYRASSSSTNDYASGDCYIITPQTIWCALSSTGSCTVYFVGWEY